jgi:hypothetical protein
MQEQDQHRLSAACEDFGVPIAKAITDAGALLGAARKLLAATRAETAPDPDSLTIKNIGEVHAAMVAWPAHAERVAAAERLAAVAASKLAAAWAGFVPTMLDLFRAPFDDAANRVLAGDACAVPELQQLDGIRDILANNGRRAECRSVVVERVTRLLTVPSHDVAMNRLRLRTEGIERLTVAWCRHAVDLGCQIKWQTPAEQEAADRILPESVPVPAGA